MRATILPYAIILTKAMHGQYDGQRENCDPNTDSEPEVFLIFTTQLYSCSCSCNAIIFIF